MGPEAEGGMGYSMKEPEQGLLYRSALIDISFLVHQIDPLLGSISQTA